MEGLCPQEVYGLKEGTDARVDANMTTAQRTTGAQRVVGTRDGRPRFGLGSPREAPVPRRPPGAQRAGGCGSDARSQRDEPRKHAPGSCGRCGAAGRGRGDEARGAGEGRGAAPAAPGGLLLSLVSFRLFVCLVGNGPSQGCVSRQRCWTLDRQRETGWSLRVRRPCVFCRFLPLLWRPRAGREPGLAVYEMTKPC